MLLNPDTPTSWIMARLRAHAPLVALLQDEHFYQPGDVPDGLPSYVLVIPPPQQLVGVYGERLPQAASSRYTICAETQTDQLPDGASFDDVLTPLSIELQSALLGVSTPIAPTGGRVWSCNMIAFHTPPPLPISTDLRRAQKGVIVELLSS